MIMKLLCFLDVVYNFWFLLCFLSLGNTKLGESDSSCLLGVFPTCREGNGI